MQDFICGSAQKLCIIKPLGASCVDAWQVRCGSFCTNFAVEPGFQSYLGGIWRQGSPNTLIRERSVSGLAEDFVIEMLNITKEFPGIKANDNITLQLAQSEVHALLGEKRCRQTHLMSVLVRPVTAGTGHHQEKRQAKSKSQTPTMQMTLASAWFTSILSWWSASPCWITSCWVWNLQSGLSAKRDRLAKRSELWKIRPARRPGCKHWSAISRSVCSSALRS